MGKKVTVADGEIVGYCVRCKKKQKMVGVKVVVSKSGMNMAKGQCIKCSCNMCKIMGKA
jgi:hypothetical protein